MIIHKPKILIMWIFLFSLLGESGFAAGADTGKIVGFVINSENGEALPGANIQILETVRGASADEKGHFIIDRVPPGTFAVRASMIGFRAAIYDSVTVAANRETQITILLHPTPIQFDPIVISAGKTKQRLDQAPVSISVVTSQDILRRNPTNIIEALENTSGIHFVGDQINIRGSTGYTFGAGNKVLLLLDGVPVYASDSGKFNWDMLPPLDIEQIEVLKGAGSTLWGASALGGVINVITKEPSPDGRLLFSFSAGKYDKPYYDTWRWTNPNRLFYNREDVSYSKRFGALGMRVSAGRFISTGYRELGDFQKYNLTGKFDYRFSRGAKWTGYGALSTMDQGFFIQWKSQNEPYQVDEANLDNYATNNELLLYSKLSIPFSPRFAVNARASLTRSLTGNQFGESADFNPAYGQGLELQSDWIPHINHVITAGVQYQHDAGGTKFYGNHSGYFVGSYMQDEWHPKKSLRFTLGLRYDRYQLIGGLKEDLFSPRIGVNWQPWQTTSFRASAGSGFRAATIIERFLELSIFNFKIKANPDLKSESAWAYEFGIRQYLGRNWNIDIALFDNEYWRMIEANMDLIRGQIQFRNIHRARIHGIEATMNFSLSFKWLGLDFTPALQTSITAMDHKDLNFNEPLVYRPKTLATIKPSLQIHSMHLEAVYRYASKIDEVKIYPINDRVPMKFVDVRASYKISSLTFQLGINNLLNYNYAPMESNLLPMRTFTAGLQARF